MAEKGRKNKKREGKKKKYKKNVVDIFHCEKEGIVKEETLTGWMVWPWGRGRKIDASENFFFFSFSDSRKNLNEKFS